MSPEFGRVHVQNPQGGKVHYTNAAAGHQMSAASLSYYCCLFISCINI